MAIDEWHIPIEPTRALKRDVAAFKNGTEATLKSLSMRVVALQEQVDALTDAINELVSILKEEIKKGPLEKKELPPPPYLRQ